jgi:hypothetical protein
MMNIPRTAEVLLVAALSGFGAYLLGSCGKTEARDDARVAYKLANHYRWQRDSTEAAQRKTDTVTRTVIVRDRSVLAQRDSLMSVLTYAEDVLADSAASLVTVRTALAVTVSRVREYQTAVDSLQASTRELIAAHALERLATNKTLAAADSTIKAYKAVADTERRQARGKIACSVTGASGGGWAGASVGGPLGALGGAFVGGVAGAMLC